MTSPPESPTGSRSESGSASRTEHNEFRSYCRAWLSDNRPPPAPVRLPQHPIETMTRAQLDYLQAWQRRCYDAGLVGADYPTEYGGGGHKGFQRIANAKSLVYAAAEALDAERDDAPLLAHMAAAQASEAAAFASNRAVQLHGGIGFTWESDVHFFFKRNKHSELLFGDAAYHQACVATLLIDG